MQAEKSKYSIFSKNSQSFVEYFVVKNSRKIKEHNGKLFRIFYSEKKMHFQKKSLHMQPEIVRMSCSIGNRIRTWILSSDSDSAHLTVNICHWKNENRIVIWKLRFSRNCQQNSEKNRKSRKFRKKRSTKNKNLIPESASHPSVLIWAVGMCTAP